MEQKEYNFLLVGRQGLNHVALQRLQDVYRTRIVLAFLNLVSPCLFRGLKHFSAL
jgi:hypothetical protein